VPADTTQTYRELLPSAALAPYVSCFWLQHVSEQGPAYRHRTVPNGCVEIVASSAQSTLTVIGPQRGPQVEALAPGAAVIGVRLRPGATTALLGIPADSIVDDRIGLEDLCGRQATRLAEQLGELDSPEEAPTLLARLLELRARDAPAIDPVIACLTHELQPWHRTRIDDLARDLFLSSRQLRRRCLTALGYGPKTLQRLLRFQGFLALSHFHQAGSVARLAIELGYTDQAHLTRESVELAGLAPRRLLSETARSCGANHDHAASFRTAVRLAGMPAASGQRRRRR